MMSLFLAVQVIASKAAPRGLFGIHIVLSAKAYWDGEKKSCVPREKGGCCHIWTDNVLGPGDMAGELENPGNGSLILTISKSKGMLPETYNQYFRTGKLVLDGTMTFAPEVLSKLNLRRDFTVPGGAYSCTFNGDLIVVTLK